MSGRQKESKQLKQQMLDQINKQQEAIEALSDEELESVAGGYMIANVNTGVVVPHNVNTGQMMPHNINVNTGAVMPARYLNPKGDMMGIGPEKDPGTMQPM
jgi:hypothetical protein